MRRPYRSSSGPGRGDTNEVVELEKGVFELDTGGGVVSIKEGVFTLEKGMFAFEMAVVLLSLTYFATQRSVTRQWCAREGRWCTHAVQKPSGYFASYKEQQRKTVRTENGPPSTDAPV